jgi:hypothetical protein
VYCVLLVLPLLVLLVVVVLELVGPHTPFLPGNTGISSTSNHIRVLEYVPRGPEVPRMHVYEIILKNYSKT